jgi:hypothetical protein
VKTTALPMQQQKYSKQSEVRTNSITMQQQNYSKH